MHPQTHRSLVQAREFMRHAYDRPISLRDIAARANLSPYHFLRVRRRAYGETPHEFLTRLRIERAKTLLARGSHNVTEACFEVGFSSLGSYSALFASRVSLSPSGYRRHAARAFWFRRRFVRCSCRGASPPCSSASGTPRRTRAILEKRMA